MRATPRMTLPLVCVLMAACSDEAPEPTADEGVLLPRDLGALEVRRVAPELALARSATSELVARLAPDVVRLESSLGDGWGVAMRLEASGRPGALDTRHEPTLEVEGSRATLSEGGVTEWYDSGAQGLMHGFTVERAPEAEGDTLRFEVAVQGAEVHALGTRALTLTSSGTTMRYERLMAWDANGRLLGASMRPSDGGFTVDVTTPDDTAYPVTVDPVFVRTFTQDGERSSLDASGDRFGLSVDIDGDLMVIGSPFDDFAGTDAGAFYTYQWDPDAGWVFVSRQAPPNAQAGSNAGFDVSLDGQYLAVGSPGHPGSDGGITSFDRGGMVSVFEFQSGTWIHQRSHMDIVFADDNELGKSVAIQHPWVFAGAPGSWNYRVSAFTGTVLALDYENYVFADLNPQGLTKEGAELGASLAVADDVLFSGAPDDDRSGTAGGGAVYYWLKDPNATGPNTWGYTRSNDNVIERNFDARLDGRFGSALAATSDNVVVGEPGSLPGGTPSPILLTGHAYIYRIRPIKTFFIQQTLMGTSIGSRFGAAVELDGDLLLVSAPRDGAGRVETYSRISATSFNSSIPFLSTQSAFRPTNGSMGDGYGMALGLSGDRAVVGAPGRDTLATDAGEVHVIEVDDPPVAMPTPSISVDEDGSTSIMVTATDPDTIPSMLSYSFQRNPINGRIFLDEDELTYTPDPDFSGVDTITYEISDGTNTTPGFINVNVIAVNDAPVATSLTVMADEDVPRSIVLAGTDVDTAAASLSYSIIRDADGDIAKHGDVTGGPPMLTYTPTPGLLGHRFVRVHGLGWHALFGGDGDGDGGRASRERPTCGVGRLDDHG